ncbi:MAG: poly(A) polymerase [Pelagibacterales bacterium]|nr:poly(A) polymerase [Pelagibacterales bacterium]
MIKKIQNFFFRFDLFLYKKFGSHKTTKILENDKINQLIFSYLNSNEKQDTIKFVGGCVRKALNGEKIDDIDLATSLEPEEVKSILINKDIKVIDTGITHGTVTAIIKNKSFEITTLRKDLQTDGRHAKVVYTNNWKEDSLRRDFTFNAIYSDINGRIFDPLNGTDDLKNGKIKFIGLAEERIQEDYLRILRYFRFFIQYSKVDHQPEIIRSIKKNINGVNKISRERIFDELKKILKVKNLYNLFLNKESKKIILGIFPQFKYFERLKMLNNLSSKLLKQYDTNLILSLLIVDNSNEHEYFCHKYKVSKNIKNKLSNMSLNYKNLTDENFYTKGNIKKLIYLSNKNEVKDLLLFSICVNKNIKVDIIEKLIKFTNTCDIPKFPISGNTLKDYGYESGVELGEKLKKLEKKWIQNNFIIDKEIIEKSLGKKI